MLCRRSQRGLENMKGVDELVESYVISDRLDNFQLTVGGGGLFVYDVEVVVVTIVASVDN